MASFNSARADTLSAFSSLKTSTNKFGVWALRILKCNPEVRTSFKNATCLTIARHTYYQMKEKYPNQRITQQLKDEYAKQLLENEEEKKNLEKNKQCVPNELKTVVPEVHPFYTLFDCDSIMNLIKSVGENENIDVTEPDIDELRRIAVKLLIEMMKTIKIEGPDHPIFKEDHKSNERSWCCAVACHLLKPLTEATVLIDNGYSNKGPCPECNGDLLYGDTSIGDLRYWHGSPDMLITSTGMPFEYPQIITKNPKGIKENDDVDLYENSNEPTKTESQNDPSNPSESVRSQVITQAITFGCIKFDAFRNSNLIPTILFFGDRVQIFMYDARYDFLFETTLQSLKDADSMTLNINTVFMVWLSLNWKLFCSGPTEAMGNENFKSGFKNRLNKKKVYDKYLGGLMNVTSRVLAPPQGSILDQPKQVTVNLDADQRLDRPLNSKRLSPPMSPSSSSSSSSSSYDGDQSKFKRKKFDDK